MLCVHVCVRAGKLPLLLSLSLPSLPSAPPPQHLSPPLHLPSLLTFLSSSLLLIFFPFFFRISWPFLHLLTFPSLLHDTASCYVILFSPASPSLSPPPGPPPPSRPRGWLVNTSDFPIRDLRFLARFLLPLFLF